MKILTLAATVKDMRSKQSNEVMFKKAKTYVFEVTPDGRYYTESDAGGFEHIVDEKYYFDNFIEIGRREVSK